MGWTSYHATYYKNGKIDRKAECDAYFLEGLNRGYYNVLKSALVGSTYYAAVQHLKSYIGEDESGKAQYEDVPENEREIFAAIFLTSTDSRDYFNFSYKDMSENSGPYKYDCPKGILDLLSPTDNKFALEWRKACYENIARKKSSTSLMNLPVGTQIMVVMPFDTNHFKEGQIVILEKRKSWSNRTMWVTRTSPICRFTGGLMKNLEGHYEIIKQEV